MRSACTFQPGRAGSFNRADQSLPTLGPWAVVHGFVEIPGIAGAVFGDMDHNRNLHVAKLIDKSAM